jgi:hypothetical protein
MKAWLARFALLFVSGLAALAMAEIATRVVSPLKVVERRSYGGEIVQDWLVPGAHYRQVSSEFDAETTISSHGYRVPEVDGNPDLLFVGDSNTFGWGLSDDQTFAVQYCRMAKISCVNLGAPGTGTIQQVERLEDFLGRFDWKPAEVKLFMFAMTASFSGGNDLADNYWYVRWRKPERPVALPSGVSAAPADRSWIEWALEHQDFVLERSNLARLIKFHWGPLLRTAIQPGLADDRRQEALELTRGALSRLDLLSKQRHFSYRIYLLHPMQDLMRGTHEDTARALADISVAPVQSLAPLFLDDPGTYYYPLDGHINGRAAEAVVRHLMAESAAH